jgi:hypothetical protein
MAKEPVREGEATSIGRADLRNGEGRGSGRGEAACENNKQRQRDVRKQA